FVNHDVMSKNSEISVLSSGGLKLNTDLFKDGISKTGISDENVEKLFDFYNTNNDDMLDETELNSMFKDIQKAAAATKGKDTFDVDEIYQYLKDNKMESDFKVSDVINFLNTLSVQSYTEKLHKDISKFTTSSSTLKDIENIPTDKMAEVLARYKKNYSMSMFQHIAYKDGAWGSTREKYMNAIRDKLIAQANACGVDVGDFQAKFDAEIKSMDMTWLSQNNTEKLDKIVNSLTDKIIRKQKIKTDNKNGILDIMTDNPKLYRTNADKEKLAEHIMEWSEKNNPTKMISEIAKSSKNPKIKQAAQKLLNSKILDYFPIFAASIIAQESQFREFDEDVFTKNGQGLMQVTQKMLDDIYANPGAYDDNFIKHVKGNYKDSQALRTAIMDKTDSSMNIYVGTAGLKAKVNSTLKKIKNGTIEKGVNTNYPEVILQYVAMSYNGNSDGKKDPKFDNKLSQVKYVYGRDVIERFERYLPADVSAKHYFEYNPSSKQIATR
ncbi:MAG: hypothetical protein NC200_08515, partial [Candidatus Gastranaerophilales bacterium]|nr:hypothetical protein [Candidatus Gastranaerophilales bacterium]